MSFRRTLSFHERALQNGSPFSLSSSPIHGASPMASPRSNAVVASVTSLSQSEGLIPFGQNDFLSSTTSALGIRLQRREDFAVEWRGFAITLQRKASKLTGREQETVSKEAEDLEFSSNHSVRSYNADSLRSKMMETSTGKGSSVYQKLLIVITPTYTRPFQALYLTRLAHTLKLVPPPLLWLVVEAPVQSLETAGLLRNTGVLYRHLVCTKNISSMKDRGIQQRNIALAHIERHQLDGIVYFANDDNVYTLGLFQQLREIKRVGTWPVGMLAHSKSKTILEGPVCEGNTVIGWHTSEKSKRLRRFHVDMSGFGFNSSLLWDPQTWHRPTQESIRDLDTIKEGLQETTFIEQLVEDESQMEGLPSGCSKVMVWHLHLEAQGSIYPSGWTLERNLEPTFH
ncbi:hypothetical protein O6H91_13G053800 [Diphasiastrum complanatum]|uniref:Uncharacterized protein n=1 Tax=Diphasiastrum complanatum TaxID=34168 RepID=A0ACC2BV01_DIPCM|nr:hypothetical protein O6H91_13G053800 [Diphasiastrum complanatum]